MHSGKTVKIKVKSEHENYPVTIDLLPADVRALNWFTKRHFGKPMSPAFMVKWILRLGLANPQHVSQLAYALARYRQDEDIKVGDYLLLGSRIQARQEYRHVRATVTASIQAL